VTSADRPGATGVPPAGITLGEGGTPVIALPRLAARWGLGGLSAKLESVNPTGSYKDRIAAATMTVALRDGRRGWIATSSGNGGAAMSAYGARAGLPGVLCVPTDAPPEKLATIRPYGALMVPMVTVDVAVMAELSRIAEQQNLMLAITTHAHNPEGMRGADAIGAELTGAGAFTQVYVPSGGGGLVTATARGLRDVGSTAAVVVCQPAGCAPIARYVQGDIDSPQVPRCETAVSGLQLPQPPDGVVAAAAVRASGGWGTWVEDEASWRIQDELATTEGVFVEPASALAVAAVAADAAEGRLGADDHPVVVLTGSGMKDLRRFALPVDPATVAAIDEIARRVGDYLAAARERWA
jgi:threonine synthase